MKHLILISFAIAIATLPSCGGKAREKEVEQRISGDMKTQLARKEPRARLPSLHPRF